LSFSWPPWDIAIPKRP